MHRWPEVLVDQHAAATFVTNFTLLSGRASFVATVTMTPVKSGIVRIGMIRDHICAMAFRARNTIEAAFFMTGVAMGVNKSG